MKDTMSKTVKKFKVPQEIINAMADCVALEARFSRNNDAFPDVKYSAIFYGKLEDAKDLNVVLRLLEENNPIKAYSKARSLDTYVREGIPDNVYDYLCDCMEFLPKIRRKSDEK